MPAVLFAGPYFYAEFTVFSPAVAENIASAHFMDPWRDGQ